MLVLFYASQVLISEFLEIREDPQMFDRLKMRVTQITEIVQSNGWGFVFKEMVFLHRIAIVVEKDLCEIPDHPEVLARSSMKVVEINNDMIERNIYDFALRSRRLKALRNLRRGCGGMALVRDNRIIGDTWHWASDSTDDPRFLHEDLRRFGFKSWARNHVYTFDIFVAPAERRSGISAAFQNSAMLHLRAKGFTKGYGFYWADNIPAHWCTRVTNKWKKVCEVPVSRCLFFTWADAVAKEQAISSGLPAVPRP